MAAPAWLGTLRSGTGGDDVPGYWNTAMAWLGRTDPTGRTLLLPATGFAEYTWGTTDDEPAQALAGSPWAVRSQIPLGSQGNTRLMDEVDAAIEDGRGAPGLADLLARSGFEFLLLRNDIDRTATDSPPVGVLRAGLAASPGIQPVASFGPLQIYRVERSVPLATTVDEQDVATVSGGPESLLPLLDDGSLAADQPAVLTGDGGSPEGPVLGTDGLRRQERNFGQVRDDLSQTLTATEAPRQQRATTDILPFPADGHQTVAAYQGIADVTASTSVSYADAVSGSDPSHQPFAALDGDPSTAWYSSSYTGPVGQWWQVDLSGPTTVDRVSLSFVDDVRVGWPVTSIRITTDAGSVDRTVAPGSAAQTFTTAPGATRSVRVTVLAAAGGRQTGNVGIAEVAIPGVHAARLLQTPNDLPAGRPASFTFTRGTDPRYACQPAASGEHCDAALAATGEEPDGLRRQFPTSVPAGYQLSGTVLPSPGGTDPVTPTGVQVGTSSELGGDPTAGGQSAIDGQSATGWIADVTDPYPWLRLSWERVRAIDSIQLTPSSAGGALPTRVELITATSDQVLTPDRTGRLTFPRTRTNWLKLVVLSDGGQGPVGIGELRVSGLDSVGLSLHPAQLPTPLSGDTPFVVPCGQGPTVTIDGTEYQTSVRGTLADYLAHRPVPFTTCGAPSEGIQLGAGQHQLATGRTAAFVVQDVALRLASAGSPTVATRTTTVTGWGTTHRTVRVGAGPAAVLTVPENANPGWVATLDGHRLTSTRVDGWQQAWVVPAGQGGTISLDFTPDTTYRFALLVGALAVLALLIASVLPVRRRGYRAAAPSNGRGVPIVLLALTGALGGAAGLGLLVGWFLVRRWLRVPVTWWCVALATVATALAVAGRLFGYGQDWAQGGAAQAVLLAAVTAVIIDVLDPVELDDLTVPDVLAVPARRRSRPVRRPTPRRRRRSR
jgi:arabinofuranan 3-O-arabinosyltransferase